MKISNHWLREWVAPKLDARALASRLTLAGLEVGAVEPVAPPLERVVVGKILSIAPHPVRANLVCCDVDTGAERPLRIVCGAPNAVPGIKVPVAPVGAAIAGGRTVERRAIDGAESEGVLCSAADLGLEEASAGLLVLDRRAPVGAALVKYLGLDDMILDIDITPNRGDCMSVAGIAREVAAITGVRLRPVPTAAVQARSRRRVAVALRAGNACPRYVGRVIENIRIDAVTPAWMLERLRRSGIRSLHPVVDVTNYVMLELGQPMHAFDLERLHRGVVVREAAAGETLTLLDGNTASLPAGATVIADGNGPIALAGIMGGRDSAVIGTTRHIFLESAWFAPDAIAGRARALGVQTESSQRFERGVDPALQRVAIERATALLQEIVGGVPGPVIEARKKALPPALSITLRRSRLKTLLGDDIAPRDVETVLKRLGMRIKKSTDGWYVHAPSYRRDIDIEVDLIEEIARLRGYDRIRAQLPEVRMTLPPSSEAQIELARLRALLVDREYQEAITYSFVDAELQKSIDPDIEALRLANPISADMAVMRTSLWPGLLQVIVYNRNRQQARLRFFEIGRRFIPRPEGGIDQGRGIAGAVMGSASAEQWGSSSRPVDFYDVKADVEALIALKGTFDCRFASITHPALHPGQSAGIYFDDRCIGTLGVLHPSLQQQLGLDERVVLFELELMPLIAATIPVFREVSRFPAIRRDLAVVVSTDVSAQAIVDTIRKVAGNLLVNLELFDEYRGEGIDSGNKSIALGLTLQDSSRTLKETEIDALLARVVTGLAEKWGARLR